MGVLEEIQRTIAAAAGDHGPAVVGVGRGWRAGTGTVVAPGRIATAAYNAREGASAWFPDRRRAEARLVGVDRDLGVAVVEADTGDIEPLAWSDQEPEVGSAVVALANPAGRGLRATLGFVSATGRSFRGPRGRRIHGAIEHTAPLISGSAGGPLLDAEGRLLGLNAIRVEGGLIVALSAAGGLRAGVESLARGEEVARPRLGVAVAPPFVARRMRRAVGLSERGGLLVRAVEPGSAAEAAGLAEGDLIVTVANREVDGTDSLHRALDAAAGGTLALGVVRGEDEREIQVPLAGEAAA